MKTELAAVHLETVIIQDKRYMGLFIQSFAASSTGFLTIATRPLL